MTQATLGLCLMLAIANTALAHDESMHKGRATRGTVTAVSSDELTMRTDGGTVTVKLSDATKIERGKAAAPRESLRTGAHVTVFGTKVPGEGLLAKEVLIEQAGADAEGEPSASQHHDHH